MITLTLSFFVQGPFWILNFKMNSSDNELRIKTCQSSCQLCAGWLQNVVKVEGLIDEGSTICVFTFLNFNPRTLNFERKYWEQSSCTIIIFIKPRFYSCPALWVLHPLCQLLSKLSVNRAHICHKYHILYLWRKNCHVCHNLRAFMWRKMEAKKYNCGEKMTNRRSASGCSMAPLV